MGKGKLVKFEAISKMSHVIEPTMEEVLHEELNFKGKWNSNFFKNDAPIVLELGCGKGEYTVGLAKKHPDKNFIGIDIKGNRIYTGAKQTEENKLENVRFLRTKIDFIASFFAKDEVSEIWLTFSDPQPKKPNKRLTSKMFIDRYRKILKPKGIIHLKTDNSLLFKSTEKEIEKHNYNCLFSSWDLYRDIEQLPEDERDILQIRTHYEKLFSEKGSIIKYCKFTID